MFVISMKLPKLKLALMVGCIFLALAVIIIASSAAHNALAASTTLTSSAQSNSQRIAFLKSFGWEVSSEPLEIVEIVIPSEFSDVYEGYNDIQKLQGYDLYKYRAKRAKRYTYEVLNYPSSDETMLPNIRANIVIYDGKIIGGDVCSTELSGFMHGFKLTEEDKQN